MFVKKKLLATLSLLLLLLPILSAISQKSNWIASDAAIDEPVKPKVEVLESNASKTVLSIAVPSMEQFLITLFYLEVKNLILNGNKENISFHFLRMIIFLPIPHNPLPST